MKDRLKKLSSGDEHDTLTDYLETDEKLKEAKAEAQERFEAAESTFLARLTDDPLPDSFQDLRVVVHYLQLLDGQSALKAKVKAADEALDLLAYEKYPPLTTDEVKTLVVDDKWLATLGTAVQGELDRVSQTLTGRIRQLAERYVTPLPKLVDDVAVLAARVDGHLKRMGAV